MFLGSPLFDTILEVDLCHPTQEVQFSFRNLFFLKIASGFTGGSTSTPADSHGLGETL